MRDWEKKRNEEAMLMSLLKNKEKLTDRERSAFERMEHDLRTGRYTRLSTAQKDWVEGVYLRLELDAEEAENLVSSGSVPLGRPVLTAEVLKNLPKAPPGRK